MKPQVETWGTRRLARESSPRLPVLRVSIAPKVRAQCEQTYRPCKFVACRYHLLLAVLKTGAIQFNWGSDLDVLYEMPHTCSLDAANEGPKTLEECATILNISREQVRVVQDEAIKRLKAALAKAKDYLDE